MRSGDDLQEDLAYVETLVGAHDAAIGRLARVLTIPSDVTVPVAAYEQAVLDGDIDRLAGLWTDDYTLIDPQGTTVTRAQRLANFAFGNTNVGVIDDEREITVRANGVMAVAQNLAKLRDTASRQPAETDLRDVRVCAAVRRLEARYESAHPGDVSRELTSETRRNEAR